MPKNVTRCRKMGVVADEVILEEVAAVGGSARFSEVGIAAHPVTADVHVPVKCAAQERIVPRILAARDLARLHLQAAAGSRRGLSGCQGRWDLKETGRGGSK